MAAAKEATLQITVLTIPTRRTPKRSSSSPEGSWSIAYVQLYALERYPNITAEIPNEASSASRETERFTRCARSFVWNFRSEEHTSELQSHSDLVCRLLLERKNQQTALATPQAPLPSAT